VSSGEITIASRSVVMDDVAVTEGQIIGLVDGRLCSAGSNLEQILERTLETMAVKERDLVSVYYGQDVSEEDAQAFAAQIEALYPHVEVEMLPGGQPFYMYILGAE
jgi:dihydroxyacetone kinase-like predicted kinase